MPAFLSPEWLRQATGEPQSRTEDALVIEEHIPDSPFGPVSYRVVVDGARAWIETGGNALEPNLTITVGYETAAAIAQGKVSTQRALMEGRMRIRGSVKPLAGRSADLIGVDPLPPGLRDDTTY
jgi:hypothetical protein